MQRGLIDSATISQLVQCLDLGTKNQFGWSIQEAIDLTALAIRERHLTVAPGLSGPKGVSKDTLDSMLDGMLRTGIVRLHDSVSDEHRQLALTKSKQWIGRKTVIAKVSAEVNRLHSDTVNYQNWIDWAARKAWSSHSRRLGGLVDETYEPYVAQVLGMDNAQIAEMRIQSTNESEINRLIKTRGADFDIMSRAYLASSIMRGRYHEELAAIASYQLKRHPLRAMVSRRQTGAIAYSVHVLPAAWCLSCIVLFGAIQQSTLHTRIDCWVSNMTKIRSFFDRGGIQFRAGSDSAAMDSAVLVARQAGVEIVNRRIDTVVEIAVGLGIGALTSMYLSPWIGVPTGVAARTTLKRLGFPSRTRNSIAYDVRDTTLRDVMSGRIESHWTRHG